MKLTIPSRSLKSTVPSCPFCTTPTWVGVYSKAERRYRCNKTFADTFSTPLHHLKSDAALVALVLTLLAYGCPTQAVVHAYNLDERTVGN